MPGPPSPVTPTYVQPDHFYPTGNDSAKTQDEPGTVYDPADDPACTRGIPVFKPTMEEFADFEEYMTKIDIWGRRSGIVKIIPPAEWTASLPSTRPLLPGVTMKNPIEQRMQGGSGLFRQQNIEKRKTMSVMDWARMCDKEGLKTPSPKQPSRRAPTRSRNVEARDSHTDGTASDASSTTGPATPPPIDIDTSQLTAEEAEFYSNFKPESSWLPPDTVPSDYSPEACRELERTFWRSCGIIKPAWYGADMSGSLFTDETKTFNVAKLPSFLSRLTRGRPIAGVNTPYLYFGMWRATFAWHVEDMDLYSINYVHWGAPKFWYAIPNEKSKNFESIMRGYFPSDKSQCPEFLRHKSFLASPNVLAQSSCRPNVLVQHQGELVITFPRGYHAGFNLGLNCAESTNFALESWIDLGRTAGVCQCVPDSVSINVDALLQESAQPPLPDSPGGTKRSWEDANILGAKPSKRMKTSSATPGDAKPRPKPAAQVTPVLKIKTPLSVTFTKPPRKEKAAAVCCLCISTTPPTAPVIKAQGYAFNLLRCVSVPSTGATPNLASSSSANTQQFWAHEVCARVIPETWVDEDPRSGEKFVYGVDCIVRERWALKCNVCPKPAQKAVGAKIQCSKGKCPKAFHVTCAIENEEVGYEVLDEVTNDVVLVDPPSEQRDANAINAANAGELQLIKKVKKFSVSCLCPQHNPVVIEARKKQRQDKMRRDLLALPPQSRIRVRVSNGVFEVTLLAVRDASQTVEVLWGDGVRRDVKWSNIVGSLPIAPVDLQVQRAMPTGIPGMSASSGVPQYSVSAGITSDITPQQPHKSGARPVTSIWQAPPGPSSQGLALPAYRPLVYQPYSTVPPPSRGYPYPITPLATSSTQGQQNAPKDGPGTSSPYGNAYGMPGWPSAHAWATTKFSPTPPPGSFVSYRAPTPVARPTHAPPVQNSSASGVRPSPAPRATASTEPSDGRGPGSGPRREGSDVPPLPLDISIPKPHPPPVQSDDTIIPLTPAPAPRATTSAEPSDGRGPGSGPRRESSDVPPLPLDISIPKPHPPVQSDDTIIPLTPAPAAASPPP